jgi:hypothetical protein
MAERVGFEPTLRHNRKPDFESGAFDHSATSPLGSARARFLAGGKANHRRGRMISGGGQGYNPALQPGANRLR